eukprot:2302521-Amphidinium_carterae.1
MILTPKLLCLRNSFGIVGVPFACCLAEQARALCMYLSWEVGMVEARHLLAKRHSFPTKPQCACVLAPRMVKLRPSAKDGPGRALSHHHGSGPNALDLLSTKKDCAACSSSSRVQY